MVYEVDEAAIADDVAALPADARAAFAELRTVLELVPWNGRPVARSNPAGQFRWLPLNTASGSGFVQYVIMEHEYRVSLVGLIWT